MRRALLFGAAIPVIALGLASVVCLPKKMVYNASESAPTGLYWLDNRPVERGDYVLVSIPERVKILVEERGYLPPDVPFLKRVVGMNGDRICRRDEGIFVNDKPFAVVQTVDALGRPMPDWYGCHILTERTVFLLQDHPQSFDGRYFGPVDRRLIIGRATRLRLPWRNREKS